MYESILWVERGCQIVRKRQDLNLTSFVLHIEGEEYSLRKSTYHPSLWFVVKAPRVLRPRTVRLPDDTDLPDVSVFGEAQAYSGIPGLCG